MLPRTVDLSVILALAVATLGGLSVGIERQWSGHAAGPRARFAGIRTFTLLGLGSGLSGWLWATGLHGPSLVFLTGLTALVVVAYFHASRIDIDGTTEVAALVVVMAGLLCGIGYLRLGAGITALTTMLLIEKSRLHAWVRGLDRLELRAGARFAVMALVLLPLLPTGPYGPAETIRPRLLWALVLFFSGLSFVGYIARRLVGAERGYVTAGTLGGLLSSTSVTLTFARLSRTDSTSGRALAAGTLGANAVLFPRVLVASAFLAPALARTLWPWLLLPVAIASVLAFRGLGGPGAASARHHRADANPLQVVAALQMALLFQLVLFGVALATYYLGRAGIYGAAAVLGLADMDALTVSMAELTTKGSEPAVTARALLIGLASNTVVKLGLALVVGRGQFRLLTAAGLAAILLALVAAIVLSVTGLPWVG